MKSLLKAVLNKTPYRVVRRSRGNRFTAIEDALTSMKARGFSPRIIIDGGANVGDFSALSLHHFPEVMVHAFEPQPGCQADLERLRRHASGRLAIHPVALCGPEHDGSTLRLGTDASATSTGAHVLSGDISAARVVTVPCGTLDALIGNMLRPEDRALLKLDLQGYELHALKGATHALRNCEAVLTEASFYTQAYEPSISVLVAFLAGYGFEMYDIAAVNARTRDDRPRQADLIFARRGSLIAADTSWS